MRPSVRAIALLVVVAGACTSTIPIHSSPPSAEPVAIASASTAPVAAATDDAASASIPIPSPADAPTTMPLPSVIGVPPDVACPIAVASPMRLRDFLAVDVSCFGHAEISIVGWAAAPLAIGWEPPLVAPAWLIYPTAATSAALWDTFASGGACLGVASPACPWAFVHVAPGSSLRFDRLNRWVVVTGHVNDPAARSCHYVYAADATQTEKLPNSDAQHWCAESLVITSVRETSTPSFAP